MEMYPITVLIIYQQGTEILWIIYCAFKSNPTEKHSYFKFMN